MMRIEIRCKSLVGMMNFRREQGVVPVKIGNKVLLNSFQSPFKDLREGF